MATPMRAPAAPVEEVRAARGEAHERSLISPMDLRTWRYRLLYAAILLVLLGALATALFPLYWMFTNAFKPTAEIYKFPPSLVPQSWDPANFKLIWEVFPFPKYFRNTLVIALGTLLLQITVSSMAGYALSKLRPALGRVVLLAFLSTLMVPSVAYLIPQFLNIRSLPILHISLFNTYWAIWLPAAASAFNIFLFKGFFDEIPNELVEAARVDGASALQIFWRIILPLSRPVLAVVGIFTFTGSWNDFLWPLLVIQDPNKQPVSVALYYLNTSNVQWNAMMAALLITALPPILVALLFQRQLVRGLAFTGLTG